MIITPRPDRVSQILSAFPLSSPGRSKGLHLSDIIRYIMIHAEPEKYLRDDGDAFRLRINTGLRFEEAIERSEAAALFGSLGIIRPGEILQDGILMTPDGVELREDGELVVHEYKNTWKSSRQSLTHDKHWAWMMQIKSYCFGLATRYAELWPRWVNNDYAPPSPKLACFDLEFTTLELFETWDMVLRHKKGALDYYGTR